MSSAATILPLGARGGGSEQRHQVISIKLTAELLATLTDESAAYSHELPLSITFGSTPAENVRVDVRTFTFHRFSVAVSLSRVCPCTCLAPCMHVRACVSSSVWSTV